MLQPVTERRIGHARRLAKILIAAEATDKIAQDKHTPPIADRRHDAGDRAYHSIETLRTHRTLSEAREIAWLL
jgi:hypothetical protein